MYKTVTEKNNGTLIYINCNVTIEINTIYFIVTQCSPNKTWNDLPKLLFCQEPCSVRPGHIMYIRVIRFKLT